jgi:hypothetical protein
MALTRSGKWGWPWLNTKSNVWLVARLPVLTTTLTVLLMVFFFLKISVHQGAVLRPDNGAWNTPQINQQRPELI